MDWNKFFVSYNMRKVTVAIDGNVDSYVFNYPIALRDGVSVYGTEVNSEFRNF